MNHPKEGGPAPVVSVIMSNFRGGAHLGAAIESVLAQSLRDLELIVVDDCSGDESLSVAETYRQRDNRVRVIALATNLGPAGARNRGIAEARGEWLAIVDNDDLIYPERLRFLRDAAVRDDADIVADDLLIFHQDGPQIGTMLAEATTEPAWIDLPTFIRSNAIYGPTAALGYCKPLIRRRSLGDIRYDESLRIGEDAKLLVQLLVAGRRFRIYPALLYFYRKHGRSISHRLSEANSQSLIRSETEMRRAHAGLGPDVVGAHTRVLASLKRAAAFAALIDGLKKRAPAHVARAISSAPSAVLLLKLPLQAYLERRLQLRSARADGGAPSPVLLVLHHGGAVPESSDGSARRQTLANLFRERGYTISEASVAPGVPIPARADGLRVARHARVAGNAVLLDESVAPTLMPYTLDADGPVLELAGSELRVHRRDATTVVAMPSAPASARLPVPLASEPSPGQDGTLLITGSSTAAECAGLRWFLLAVWPRIRALHPAAILTIAGGIARGTGPLPPGVVARADGGAGLLHTAGLVVAPCTIRSDGPPSLIEALRHGKAVVATRTGSIGLPEAMEAAIRVGETATAMAAEIVALLAAPDQRRELGQAALALLGSSTAVSENDESAMDILFRPATPRLG